MVRYRELRSIRQLEKEFPFQVEIVVPPGGLGRRLDEIEAWLAANVPRAEFARWGRQRDGKDVAVWGFRDEALISDFWMVVGSHQQQLHLRIHK